MIFLSYASEDRTRIRALYDHLRTSGYKPWMDCEDIVGGEDWARSISRAINRADFFLACLSTNSFAKRGYLQREILEALDKWREKLPDDVFLVPIRLEQCDVPERLASFQAIDLFQRDGERRLFSAFEVGLKRLERAESPNQGEGAAYRVVPKRITEQDPDGKVYSMTLAYPQISPENSTWASEVNHRLAGWIAEQAQNFRACRLWSKEEREDRKILPDMSAIRSELSVSYSVRLFTSELLSVEFTTWFCGAGAAHGNTDFKTINLLLNPATSLFLPSLFRWHTDYLSRISTLCRGDLRKQDEIDVSEDKFIHDWLERGTSPEYDNFRAFSLTENALRILFPPYQIGPFSSGSKEITIPYTSLESVIERTGPLRSLLM